MSALRFLAMLGLAPDWPAGEPLTIGDFRWGTKLKDGTVVAAPGVRCTPLPVCSRCQQPIEPDDKQNDADNSEGHAQHARSPGMSCDLEAGDHAGSHRMVNPLAYAEREQG